MQYQRLKYNATNRRSIGYYSIHTYVECRNLNIFSKKLDNYFYKLNKTFFIADWYTTNTTKQIADILKEQFDFISNDIMYFGGMSSKLIIDSKYNDNSDVVLIYQKYIKNIKIFNQYWNTLNIKQIDIENEIIAKTKQYVINYNNEFNTGNNNMLAITDVEAFKRYMKLKTLISSF